MNKPADMKGIVKQKYAEIAREADTRGGGCCGPTSIAGRGCCDGLGGVDFSQGYGQLDGYVPDADLGLGCGLPTQFAGIEPGQTVLDLGSGAGNDVFVARSLVGRQGRVIGVDMVPEMVDKARRNQDQLGFENVEFHLGEIENLPLDDATVDVVVSNCVLNLVPDKTRAFAEIFRVIAPGGHFCISDIVLEGDLPPELAGAAVLYAGCVAGAQQKDEYLGTIAGAGFADIDVKQSRQLLLPDALLDEVLTPDQAASYRFAGVGIFSITVTGRRPEA